MRLIDADAIMPKGTRITPDNIEVAKAIRFAPTIDAVPVVRCRECKHCNPTIFNRNFIGFCEIRKDSYGAKLRVGLSDYCSDGERKEGDEG